MTLVLCDVCNMCVAKGSWIVFASWKCSLGPSERRELKDCLFYMMVQQSVEQESARRVKKRSGGKQTEVYGQEETGKKAGG